MAKDSSAKYYRDEKEKKSLKKILPKEKKNNMGVINIKVSLKMRKDGWLSIEKIIPKWKKRFTIISIVHSIKSI